MYLEAFQTASVVETIKLSISAFQEHGLEECISVFQVVTAVSVTKLCASERVKSVIRRSLVLVVLDSLG